MNGFFYTLLVTSVCGAICSALSVGGFEKYLKYIASLVCVCVIVSALRNVDFSDYFDSNNGFSESFPETSEGLYPLATEIAEERTEAYISEIVFSKFGINTVGCDIKIDWAQDEPVIEFIRVFLDNENLKRKNDVTAYLAETLGGEVEIVEG